MLKSQALGILSDELVEDFLNLFKEYNKMKQKADKGCDLMEKRQDCIDPSIRLLYKIVNHQNYHYMMELEKYYQQLSNRIKELKNKK